jgi:hypothetical protein
VPRAGGLGVADQEHAVVDTSGDEAPAPAAGVARPARVPDVMVRTGLGQESLELVVEGLAEER